MTPEEDPDPATLDSGQLNRRLVELQTRYLASNHVVAREDLDDIPAETVEWWRAAFAELQRRRWDIDIRPDTVTTDRELLGPQRRRLRPRRHR